MVTGGTGFVGAWTARALQDAGHGVRLLVRTPAKLETTAATIGVDISDYRRGDISDLASVDSALDGCDAVVHCAAVVAVDRQGATAIVEKNLEGSRNVLGRAVDRGLDPVVHVSSFTALFEPGVGLLSADMPVPRRATSPTAARRPPWSGTPARCRTAGLRW